MTSERAHLRSVNRLAVAEAIEKHVAEAEEARQAGDGPTAEFHFDQAAKLQGEAKGSVPTWEAEPANSSSWDAVDLAAVDLAAVDPSLRPQPEILLRRDYEPLLYPGLRNVLFGPPESGKTWIAVYGVYQEIERTERQHANDTTKVAVVIDHEDTEHSWLWRLMQFGLNQDTIARRVSYHRPTEPLASDLERLRSAMQTARIVVVDSMNESMYALGLDPVNNADVGSWQRQYLRPLIGLLHLDIPGAVLVIDHTVSADPSGRLSALGAQTKLSGVRGVQIKAVVLEQPAPGSEGRIALYATKDPNGQVRKIGRRDSDRMHLLGTFVLEPGTAYGPELRSVIIEPQGIQGVDLALETAILEAAAKTGDKGASKNQVAEMVRAAGVKVSNEVLRTAIETLAGNGNLVPIPVSSYVRYAVKTSPGDPAGETSPEASAKLPFAEAGNLDAARAEGSPGEPAANHSEGTSPFAPPYVGRTGEPRREEGEGSGVKRRCGSKCLCPIMPTGLRSCQQPDPMRGDERVAGSVGRRLVKAGGSVTAGRGDSCPS